MRVTISTSDTDAFVSESVDFVIVCPINLFGSPLITSASIISLRIYSADDGLTKNSSRSTSYASYGLEMHDPTAGTSFIGVKSTGLNPEVAEYRKLKLAVEKLKSASIDKCTSAEVMRTP